VRGVGYTRLQSRFGEPTFLFGKKVFAMFANNHHHDGHVAVWIPAAPGVRAMPLATQPETFFRPPYVGVRGWVGIELERIGDEDLAWHIREAWGLLAPKKLLACGVCRWGTRLRSSSPTST
jgi:hypothetical protein